MTSRLPPVLLSAMLAAMPAAAQQAAPGQQPAPQATPQQGAPQQAPPQQPGASGAPILGVRAGVHPDHTRLVFDWTRRVEYRVERDGDRVTVRFSQPAQADLAPARRVRQSRVGDLSQRTAEGGLEVTFTVPAGAQVKPFYSGNKVVLDVLDPAIAPPPAAEKPADKPAETKAVDAKPAESKPAAKPAEKTPPAPQRPAQTPPAQTAQAQTAPAPTGQAPAAQAPGSQPPAGPAQAPAQQARPAAGQPPGTQAAQPQAAQPQQARPQAATQAQAARPQAPQPAASQQAAAQQPAAQQPPAQAPAAQAPATGNRPAATPAAQPPAPAGAAGAAPAGAASAQPVPAGAKPADPKQASAKPDPKAPPVDPAEARRKAEGAPLFQLRGAAPGSTAAGTNAGPSAQPPVDPNAPPTVTTGLPEMPAPPPAVTPPPAAPPVPTVANAVNEPVPLTPAAIGVWFMPGTLIPSMPPGAPMGIVRQGGLPSQMQAGTAAAAPVQTVAEELPQTPITLAFDPGGPAAVAIFERAGWLYVLFDRAVPETTAPAANALPPMVRAIEVVRHPEGLGFRAAVPVVLEPKVEKDGNVWRVTMVRPGNAGPGIAVEGEPDFALGARLVAKAPEAEKVFDFADPVVGDTLRVAPLAAPGQSIPVRLDYAEAAFLPTAQGIVVKPRDVRLLVQPVRDGVEVTVPGGLRLSPPEDVTAANPPPPVVEQVRLFDYGRWGAATPGTFMRGRQARQNALLALPVAERHRGRIDLARFYVANGMGHEAKGMLDLVLQDQPDLEKRGEFLAVRGAARVLAGDYKAGLKDLNADAVATEPDTDLWRAAAAAGAGEWETAHRLFQAHRSLLRDYPEPFFSRFSMMAAEAALERKDPETAATLLDRVAKRSAQSGPITDRLAYLRGEQFRQQGAAAKAMEQWKRAAGGFDRLAQARARWGLIELNLQENQITPKQAADEMEKLRFAWRGDDLELAIQRRLGELHAQAGNYPQAFDTMRRTVSLFPESPQAEEITRQMTGIFADLYKDGAAHLPPVEALSLYEQYRELTPAGPEGDAVIRRLAERLVEIDLLDRASDLLDRQVQYRLAGEEKARVGTRLAGIRLLNAQPDQALGALDKSEVAGMPAALAEERRLLRARALSRSGRSRDAVALLAEDGSRPAKMLRVDIATQDKQWTAAAQALADLIGPPPEGDKAIDAATAKLVVNRAVALNLAQDGAALRRLREEFGPAMAKSPEANTFKVLAMEDNATGLVDAATIQARVGQNDLFKSFLEAYRAKTPEAPAQPGAAPAAPAAAPPATPAAAAGQSAQAGG
ncbi:MAG TPA: hypothetical protein VED40_03925 [Azospirillaceae bacterium]|nr:hypothetical protein [Azospirillaceae bacterium]